MQFSIEINGNRTIARRGETILSVLQRNGIRVPTLCNMQGFTPTGSCRMCVVEVDGIEGLVPACSHPVEEWMQIRTHSPKVIKARRTIVELLLANHPDDCLYCDRTGTCELQKIAGELNIRERKYQSRKRSILIDRTCDSIQRDPSKCILCERCIRVCDETIGLKAIEITGRGSNSMIGTSYNKGVNMTTCVKCGQCIMVCPTNAIREKSQYFQVTEALNDPVNYAVIQLASTVPAAIAEEFGMKPGKDFTEKLNNALLKIGFKEVYDTSLGADINTLEIAGILAERIAAREKSPLFLANCPSWLHYVSHSRPDLSGQLAMVKSPQQVMSMLIHRYFSPGNKIFSVAVSPCTAKKHEAAEDLPMEQGNRPIDVVLTIRELISVIRHFGIDLASIETTMSDNGFGLRGSSGRLYGIAGGTTESIIRSLYPKITGQELNPLKINELRSLKGRKEYRVKIGKSHYTFVAVNGLPNAKALLDEIDAGRKDIVMIEVMVCPGGCINGGGHRYISDEKAIRARIKAIHDADDEEMIKVAHKNPGVSAIYDDFLKPGNISLAREIHTGTI